MLAGLLTAAALAWLTASILGGEQSLARQKRSARDLAALAHRFYSPGRNGPLSTVEIMRALTDKPELDAWARPIEVITQARVGTMTYRSCIFSKGSDGQRDLDWQLGSFSYKDFQRDLVVCDGEWLMWPEWPGSAHQSPPRILP